MSSGRSQGGDDRFLKVTKDPRFWEMPVKEHKIKIDKRFKSMFHDERFKLKNTVDKRGRPVNHTTSEDLRRFYNLSDSEEEEDAKDKKVVVGKKKKRKGKEKPDSVDGGDKVVVKAEKKGKEKPDSVDGGDKVVVKAEKKGKEKPDSVDGGDKVVVTAEKKGKEKPDSVDGGDKVVVKAEKKGKEKPDSVDGGDKVVVTAEKKGKEKPDSVDGGDKVVVKAEKKGKEKPDSVDGGDKVVVKAEKKGKEKPDSVDGGDKVVVTAEKLQKKGKAVQSSGGKLKGEQPVRGVRVVEKDDEEEQQSIDEDDMDIGDNIPHCSKEDEDDEDDEDGNDDNDPGAVSELESGSDAKSGSESEEEDDDSGPDLARGMGNVESSSDEDEVDVILRQEEEEIEHAWGELCKDALQTDEVSARLAVCNMDWDRIKAKDLLALFNSFKPSDGVVLSVTIYPSEFGKERITVEQTQGPPELIALPEDPEEDDEDQMVFREKMREYQFKRLKYYYAVVECDSPETAAKIYEECDGYEFESSSSMMDLRFIPADVTFDYEPKDVATDVDLSAYIPKLFTSYATAMSKVELTWDETDHDRVTTMNRKFYKDELLDLDLKTYLASSSEDDDDGEFEFGEQEEKKDEETPDAKQIEKPKKKKSAELISKYKEILKSIQDKDKEKQKDKDMEMEITWVPGLKHTTEQLVKKKLEGKDKLTPWEEFLEKKKEKKKQKKAQRKQASAGQSNLSDDELPPDVDLNDPFFAEELGSTDLKKKTKGKKNKKAEVEGTPEEEEELEKRKAEMALLMDDEDDDKHKHFNYDKIVEQQNLSKKKRKKLLKKDEAVEDDDFQVDVKDPRFQAMFTSHLYNLDPSDPSYKKTKGTQSIAAEKRRRREEHQRSQETTPTQDTQSSKQEVGEKKQEMATVGSPAVAETPKTMDPGLSMLIKSIKNKTEQFQSRKKQKIV